MYKIDKNIKRRQLDWIMDMQIDMFCDTQIEYL